jgi:hypothetical protein
MASFSNDTRPESNRSTSRDKAGLVALDSPLGDKPVLTRWPSDDGLDFDRMRCMEKQIALDLCKPIRDGLRVATRDVDSDLYGADLQQQIWHEGAAVEPGHNSHLICKWCFSFTPHTLSLYIYATVATAMCADFDMSPAQQ